MKISDELITLIKTAVAQSFPDIQIGESDIILEHPSLEDHGDYSTNIALVLGKRLNQNPREVAALIAKKVLYLSSIVLFKTEVAGPGFINFYLKPEVLKNELQIILDKKAQYGQGDWGKNKTLVIDYSAPNIAKRFGIGHLRSTIIGQALYNLYQAGGWKVVGDNHLGDWGTQFGKILFMIKEKEATEFTIDDLEKWYVEFHQRVEANPELEDEGRKWFRKLEEGDPEARDLWKKCVAVSMEEFNRIYKLLNVKIDHEYGESFYEKLMPEVITEAKSKNLVKESDGALVIEIPRVKVPLMLVKKDGTTTYATRDLATLKFRQKEWHPDMVIYEVGSEQALHFVQVFTAARMLGYVTDNTALIHTKHGLYRWEHGKMKTREGSTIKLEEILQEAVSRAEKLGSPDTASAVGVGAVKYFDLSHNPQSDIIFSWEKMFNLQGDSGPYLQYTYARARSVLRKSVGARRASPTLRVRHDGPLQPEEIAVLRYLYRFPEVVEAAAKTYSPNLICSYLFDLARRFNNLYNNVPILARSSESVVRSKKSPTDYELPTTHYRLPTTDYRLPTTDSELQTRFRLTLTKSVSIVLQNGLKLLGIEALERM